MIEKDRIKSLILKLGITPDLNGYYYIIDAIFLMANEPIPTNIKITNIYKDVSKLYHNSSSSKVERGIRHAISTISNTYEGRDLIRTFLSCNFVGKNLRNSQFLMLCVEKLKSDECRAK